MPRLDDAFDTLPDTPTPTPIRGCPISHELRTPLNAAHSGLQLLLSDLSMSRNPGEAKRNEVHFALSFVDPHIYLTTSLTHAHTHTRSHAHTLTRPHTHAHSRTRAQTYTRTHITEDVDRLDTLNDVATSISTTTDILNDLLTFEKVGVSRDH